MNVVFGIAGYVVVDNHQYVVNVDASCYDIGGYQYVNLTALEAIHHVVTLSLRQIAVHGGTVYLHVAQLTRDVFHLVFLAAEDDDTLQFASLEQRTYDAQLLGFVAYVCRLLYFLCRLRDGNLHLCRII